MARVHPDPYLDMPPTSDLLIDVAASEAAIAEKLASNLELPEGAVKGAFISITGRLTRRHPGQRAIRPKAYYYVYKEKPLTFQWVPVSGHPPLDPGLLEAWRRINVQAEIDQQRRQARNV